MIGTLKSPNVTRDRTSPSSAAPVPIEKDQPAPTQCVTTVVHFDSIAADRDWSAEYSAGWYVVIRQTVEYAAALMLLVLTSPLMLLGALLVKLTSRGPVIYSQTRLGRFGLPYRIHKLRTMVHDCESQSGPCWAAQSDPRVTPVGRFLRTTHLDELPQLWNVLRGEMALLGPRPERPEFAIPLERALPRYWERMLLRPGITGLAQVQLPADTDLESVRRKLAYDLFCIHSPSAWLDCRILLCTAGTMLGISFCRLRKLFRMPAQEEIEAAFQASAIEANGRLPQVQPA